VRTAGKIPTAATVLYLAASVGVSHAIAPPPVRGDSGMVVSAQYLASEVGAKVLEQGGNAIDAAVAVAYALAVVYPCCGNIGGGGFATIRLADGTERFFDFRETAPAAATPDMFLDKDGQVIPGASLYGYKAVGVPGTVLGLDTILERYGTMDRQRIMAPAIDLAENGFVLRQSDVDFFTVAADVLAKSPNVAKIFLTDGKPWPPGHRLVQKDLGATLRSIAENGPDAFYKGPTAEAVVRASEANGGILSMADFESYTAAETEPLHCTYRGYDIASAPPPSSGGTTICQILNILEGYPVGELGFHSAAGIHVMIEAMRHAYADRNFLLGDPAFIDNPVDRLLSKDYAKEIRGTIEPNKAGRSDGTRPNLGASEGIQTTHLSVVDEHGNAVALTFTINFFFGAGIIAGDTGFFLNNEMNDFTIKVGVPTAGGLVQGMNNGIAPGKRPLSSMSPTIITKDGDVVMVVGSPGGSRIITIVAQTIMNVIDHGMDIAEAVSAPRVHHQWMPDVVYAEPFAPSVDTRERLEAMGYKIVEQNPWGASQAIMIAPRAPAGRTSDAFVQDTMVFSLPPPGTFLGASDNRRPAGAAAGR
jgi:gamma-glutamyltranspeptidase / glutathione hydrolase